MKIKDVKYISGYTIWVCFEDGESGEIDLSELVKKGIFCVLQDTAAIRKVYSTGYSIAWSDELEIDATAVYLDISGKKFNATIS